MPTESATLYCGIDPNNCVNILEKACRDNHEQIAQATATPFKFGLLEVDKSGKLLKVHKNFVALKDSIKDLKNYTLSVRFLINFKLEAKR